MSSPDQFDPRAVPCPRELLALARRGIVQCTTYGVPGSGFTRVIDHILPVDKGYSVDRSVMCDGSLRTHVIRGTFPSP